MPKRFFFMVEAKTFSRSEGLKVMEYSLRLPEAERVNVSQSMMNRPLPADLMSTLRSRLENSSPPDVAAWPVYLP